MVRWLLLLTSVLFWASSAIPVIGIDDSPPTSANDSVAEISDTATRELQQRGGVRARQRKMDEDEELRQEIEQALRAQEAHREMEERHMRKVEEKHKQELEARQKRDMEVEARRKRQEELKRRLEEEINRRVEEELQRRLGEEERHKKEEEERQKREEEERQKREEEERQKREEEERQKKEEEERRKKEEEEKKKKEEEEEELNFQHILDTKIIPELKQRCSTFPKWTSAQVERCLSFAEDGIEYDPLIFDLDDDDFSFTMNPVKNTMGHDGSTMQTIMLKVMFVVTLIVAYLRHVNWFRKSQMWNLAILKIRTIINSKHRHTG
eukprot:jgi/Picre1/35470/NNA_002932.t1